MNHPWKTPRQGQRTENAFGYLIMVIIILLAARLICSLPCVGPLVAGYLIHCEDGWLYCYLVDRFRKAHPVLYAD